MSYHFEMNVDQMQDKSKGRLIQYHNDLARSAGRSEIKRFSDGKDRLIERIYSLQCILDNQLRKEEDDE